MLLDPGTLPGFVLISTAVILTPGVDTFLLLRTSMRFGTRPGLYTLAGIHTASLVQVALVISGLGALVTSRPEVLSVLKWVGAAYLIYLAVTILRGLWRSRHGDSADVLGDAPTTPDANPYLRGLLSNITNPKMLLFSLAFLPQFVGSATSPALQLTMLGLVFLALAAVWELAIVLGASRVAGRLRKPSIRNSLDVVSAAAFLGLSVGLVAG
ncbi:Threonine/homoserine/homoserine lactone efflux protein [Actinopolyspora lacussalsi subsp. righensis]|uniref:Threonine/homoserine/homoserine lactone efflux protein n=1 Tax=Actinopolyspora righensis TaxID=995060 RepID=A0A1I6ZZ10_9ACTN|nr:LysE family translocator [Actinopolyspora righensis]SFT67889.1 Threonine/homoserine/homoserine lactone efflux protein [Actinopolyspora righensis]